MTVAVTLVPSVILAGRRSETIQLQNGRSAPPMGCEEQPSAGKECESAENQSRNRQNPCGRKPPLSGTDADGRLCYRHQVEKRLSRNGVKQETLLKLFEQHNAEFEKKVKVIAEHRVLSPVTVPFANTSGSFFPLLITERLYH